MDTAILENPDLSEEQQRCLDLYDEEDLKLMALAEAAKGKGLNRVEEIARFARAAGYSRIGIAHCVAVKDASVRLEELLTLRRASRLRVSTAKSADCRLRPWQKEPGGFPATLSARLSC